MTSRRSFLTMLGLAPIAATVPAVASTHVPVDDLTARGAFKLIVDEPGYKLSKPGCDVLNAGSIRSKDKSFSMNLTNGTLRWDDFIGEV